MNKKEMWLKKYKKFKDNEEGRAGSTRKWKFKRIFQIWLKDNYKSKHKIEGKKKNKRKGVRFRSETQQIKKMWLGTRGS
jgi:hypothetical protein